MTGQSGLGGPGDQPIQSIQLLRALAAGTVAVIHLAFAFADHVGEGLALGEADNYMQLSQAAVALFFLVSGYIMVVSTCPLFGAPDGSRRFWIRRAVRIAPPYWLATLLLAALYLWRGQDFAGLDLLRSLALLPFWSEAAQTQPLPLLWPGWTLFYEALFYFLFGLGVSAGRRWAVAIPAVVLLALIGAGLFLEPRSALLFTLTRPVSLLFIAGMALALWRERGQVLAPWLRVALAVASLACLPVVAQLRDDASGLLWLLWSGLPALLLFVAAVGGPLRVPMFAAVNLLGGASYALYLLHVPMGHLWNLIYPGPLYGLGAWPYLLGMGAATLLAALGFWLLVERPLTRALNRKVASAR